MSARMTLRLTRVGDDPVVGCARCAWCCAGAAVPRRLLRLQPVQTRTTTTFPTTPADKLYNEGLFLLNNKQDYKAAAKKFDEVDRQHPYSDWARKALLMSAYAYYQARQYDDCINAAQALRDAASRQPGRRLCAVSDRLVLLRSDPRCHARPGARRQGDHRARRGGAQISGHRIRASPPRRRSRWRATSSPARKWRSAASIMKRRDFTRRHQPLQGGGDAVSDHARMSRRRWCG